MSESGYPGFEDLQDVCLCFEDSIIGIQIKARYGNFDTIKWSISRKEIEKNAVLVCILIQEEVSEAQTEYHLILAGFLPTNMIKSSSSQTLELSFLVLAKPT